MVKSRKIGRWANNRVEGSHAPFRKRERAPRFWQIKSLQKFASVHAFLHDHFNSERHFVDRQTFKQRRSAGRAEWQKVAASATQRSKCAQPGALLIGLTPPGQAFAARLTARLATTGPLLLRSHQRADRTSGSLLIGEIVMSRMKVSAPSDWI